MGIRKVSSIDDQTQMQTFSLALLRDVQALECMLEHDWFEKDIMRIGSEQELCIVDSQTMKPAPINEVILKNMSGCAWLKPELAKFNLETNLIPRTFTGNCLSLMEKEGKSYLSQVRAEVNALGADVVMTGILPTLHRHDIQMHNLTANNRYLPLLNATKELLRGEPFRFHIRGVDELRLQSHSTLFPGCNTSFQLHLQVAPEEFTKFYNIAQAITPFLLAVSANSPIAFGKRLWHETRMILYPQGSDTRLHHEYLRKDKPRASFGDDWLHGSILDLYKDDISRYPILLGGKVEEDASEMVKNGITPKLEALQIHNSTVYRWNRPCYGISPNGKPHLRIENRIISAGPTLLDQMANAAFWYGLMIGLADEVGDIREVLSFGSVKENFERASKFSIQSELIWKDETSVSASQLILDELAPLARKGLEKRGIVTEDIDRYLGIIEERANLRINGAVWSLNAYNHLNAQGSEPNALASLTAAMVEYQKTEQPLHTWEIPDQHNESATFLIDTKVEEIMQTDLVTVSDTDLLEFAIRIMQWNEYQQISVENVSGHFVGTLSLSATMLEYAKSSNLSVKDAMNAAPVIVCPEASISEARFLMKEHQVNYLPVVKEEQLVGEVPEALGQNMRLSHK